MLRPLVGEAQASKAEHRGLPKCAESSDMNAASRVPHVVRQVDLRCLPEMALRQRSIAKASRHERMNCRAQRAAMPAARLVILEIRLADLREQPLPEEMYQHHHICLLDDLGPLDALPTEQHVHRCGSSASRPSRRESARHCSGHRSATSLVTSSPTSRFHCARPLVYALSSTVSWYSSGPITPRIW